MIDTSKIVSVEINPHDPVDRTEFWRDMEVCQRAHSPMAGRRFAYSLIRRRVVIEALALIQQGQITLAEADSWQDATTREMWHQAIAATPIKGNLDVVTRRRQP